MVDVSKFNELDLYSLLEVEVTATQNDIRKAYRKKALQCHPDKNPDNPKAAELFHELSKALEILTDATARSCYDKILNAKKATILRNKQLDNKRQKLKQDLEEREKQANLNRSNKFDITKKSPEELLQIEIERLRKEGSKLLEEEQELLREQLKNERINVLTSYDPAQYRIKIKWDIKNTKFLYTKDILQNYLKKYGDISELVLSSKNNGTALLEFTKYDAAEMAVNYEKGNLENPLKLTWLNEKLMSGGSKFSKRITNPNSNVSERDFESLVLRNLRQAEERKILINEMLKNEKNDDT